MRLSLVALLVTQVGSRLTGISLKSNNNIILKIALTKDVLFSINQFLQLFYIISTEMKQLHD